MPTAAGTSSCAGRGWNRWPHEGMRKSVVLGVVEAMTVVNH